MRAVPDWKGAVGWSGPGFSTDDWIALGHSNGGKASDSVFMITLDGSPSDRSGCLVSCHSSSR